MRRTLTIGIFLCQLLDSEAGHSGSSSKHNHYFATTTSQNTWIPNKKRDTNIYPRGGASLEQYRDVLHISKKSKMRRRPDLEQDSLSIDELDISTQHDGYIFSRNRQTKYEEETSNEPDNKNPSEDKKKTGNSVVYRYFGRSRARSVRSDSIPFIVIASCVDHWKLVGRILASRGFNCIVVERVKKSKSNTVPQGTDDSTTINEGEGLVTSILEVLKWQRAILVGCDQESILGIEAALRLAPDRVVGLVLCGDLSSFHDHVEKQIITMKSFSTGDDGDFINVESFLEHYVECPCQLVWDGDITSWPSHAADNLFSSSISKIILGGGLAPHRRLPEQFAWTLTRFVEEKVSVLPPQLEKVQPIFVNDAAETSTMTQKYRNGWNLPPQIFAPGTLLVAGRILATTIIYLSIAKVSMVQYRNFRDIQSSCLNLSTLQILKKLVNSLRTFQLNKLFALYIPKAIATRTKECIDNNEGIKNLDEIGSHLDEPDSPPDTNQNDQDDTKEIDSEEDKESEVQPSPLLQKLLFFDQIIS